jgi:glucokinase
MSKQFCLGIDLGGTNIKMAVVDSLGNIISETSLATDINEKPLVVIKAMIAKALSLKDYSKTKSIGIGIAGDINYKTGNVRFSPNLPKWKNVPLKSVFEKITKKKTYVDNDANTAAIGAFWLDTGAKADNLICITLGTGVGGGLIFNKKLYRGASFTAGEVGHITIDPYGQLCKCGNRGCIETFIGAKYISDYARKYFKNRPSAVINELTGANCAEINPAILYKAALEGDKASREIWRRCGEKLGIFLSVILNFANPDTIVLCGGISHAEKFLLGPAKREMEKRAFKSAVKSSLITVSRYTSKLGVVGAAMLAKQ